MKITSRQLSGYLRARREWISDNDGYNKQHFGITKEQYKTIHRVIVDEVGPHTGEIPSLAAINRRLSSLSEYNPSQPYRNPRRPLATIIHPVTKRRTHFWLWSTYPTRDEARRAANGLERQTGQLTKVRKLPRRRLFAVYATIERTKDGPYL